ncbi:pyridoxal phosphate-dependent decarboxylase family protein [Dongshaea marina]|uniref:pyridoxal phosphate-dependent decarboxylase family protein n=1 Tax=Dongshaea marina TaxID=2047966 RepID=UPI000D3E8D9C|nr:pyridoxal-dependent decarboxylase [Dongshaea marina]
MTTQQQIRQFFQSPQTHDNRISQLLEYALKILDGQRHGTRIGQYESTDYEELAAQSHFPESLSDEQKVLDLLLELYQGVALLEHPMTQANVLPPPSTLSVVADALSARFNENSIWDYFGISAARAEVMAVAMMADLIGYSKTAASGLFTFGGSGCNLYATRIGIEKACPNAKQQGLHQKVQLFCSEHSHYSIKSAAMWSGIGLDNIRPIPCHLDNTLDIDALERAMEASIAEGARIGTLFATMGTTDAFALDPLQEMHQLKLKFEKRVGYSIHLHADAVIGWPYLTFDQASIAKLPKELQSGVLAISNAITELKLADSIGIDFHKTGWAPYICSLLMVKDEADLLSLAKSKAQMPYLYHDEGHQPGTFTLESSRPNYALKALANMLLLGKAGYRQLLTHLLQTAHQLRQKIASRREMAVLNEQNPAFVTNFRIYPPLFGSQGGRELFRLEQSGELTKQQTLEVNDYNRRIAELLFQQSTRDGGPLISFTQSYQTTPQGIPILALKSYPMSPFIEAQHMQELLTQIDQIKQLL